MDLKSLYKEGDMTTKLIFINSAVFLFVCLLQLVDMMAGTNLYIPTILAFSLSPIPLDTLIHPWQWLTYMFLHSGFIHFIINMLMLSFSGRLFYEFWGSRSLLGVYIFGGLLGGVAFVLSLAFSETLVLGLCGASASIMALMIASAVYAPNYEIRLTLIGVVKLKWIALVFLLISMFNMVGANWAGEVSHLGGAVAGALYAAMQKKGKNIVEWIGIVHDFFSGLFKKREKKPKMKLYRNPNYMSSSAGNPTFNVKTEDEMLDCILDKIKKSGFDSLTTEERRFLDDYSKRKG